MGLHNTYNDLNAQVLTHWSRGRTRTTCPVCSPVRKPEHKLDKVMALKQNGDAILFFCHHCGERGAVKIGGERRTVSEAVTLSPINTPEPQADRSLGPEAEAYLQGRGIAVETARVTGVVSAPYRLRGQSQDALWFPYREPKGRVYAHKIRAIHEKEFSQAGGAASYWLAEQARSGEDLIIVEGEIDALSIREAGHWSVVSVPTGAPIQVSDGKINPNEDGRFKFVWKAKAVTDRAKRIVIATDADEPGRALAEELARRYGKGRVWKIDWPDGCKDANDTLRLLGKDQLKELIANPKPWPVAGVYTVNDFREEVLNLYDRGIGRGESTGMGQSVDELYTVTPGHLVVITGTPGSGKTAWTNQLMINLSKRLGWRHAVYSSETKPSIHIAMLAQLYLEQSFFEGQYRITEDQLRDAMDWLDEHFIFLSSDGDGTPGEIIDRLKTAVMRHGVRGVVIDPASYLRSGGKEGATADSVGHMLDDFKAFAVEHDCVAWLIAHPYKMSDPTSVPGGYSISGSAHWYNRPDFGLTIHRPADARHMTSLKVWKVRFQWTGREGEADLYFDKATGRYGEHPFNSGYAYSATGEDPWKI